MASYGSKSNLNLNTAEKDLQIIFREVIKRFDNSIIYGYRSPEFQFTLFKKGRKKDEHGKWFISDRRKVVTNCDGFEKKSNHNYKPSRAVDAVPYPIDWKDEKRACYFAGMVMEIARQLHEQGKVKHRLRWGGDFDQDTDLKDQLLSDLWHFELIF